MTGTTQAGKITALSTQAGNEQRSIRNTLQNTGICIGQTNHHAYGSFTAFPDRTEHHVSHQFKNPAAPCQFLPFHIRRTGIGSNCQQINTFTFIIQKRLQRIISHKRTQRHSVHTQAFKVSMSVILLSLSNISTLSIQHHRNILRHIRKQILKYFQTAQPHGFKIGNIRLKRCRIWSGFLHTLPQQRRNRLQIIHAGARIQPDTQGGTGLFNAGGKFIRKRLAHAAH